MANVKQNIEFTKMHGLGNIFIVVDNRNTTHELAPLVKFLSSNKGLVCDQFIVLEESADSDVFMRIYNKDGGEVEACGNATRCIAGLLMDREGGTTKDIETVAGVLKAWRAEDTLISVDMGEPKLDWQDIPLSHEMDTLDVELQLESTVELPHGVAVNVGNPHIVFFAEAIYETFGNKFSKAAFDTLAEEIEYHSLFPNRINANFASLIDKTNIELRVWERGAGETAACGTGACATLVAAVRKGLTDRKAAVKQQGGDLIIEWNETTNRITMTGEYAYSLEGIITKIYDQ